MYIIIDLKKILKDFFKDNNNVEGRNFQKTHIAK